MTVRMTAIEAVMDRKRKYDVNIDGYHVRNHVDFMRIDDSRSRRSRVLKKKHNENKRWLLDGIISYLSADYGDTMLSEAEINRLNNLNLCGRYRRALTKLSSSENGAILTKQDTGTSVLVHTKAMKKMDKAGIIIWKKAGKSTITPYGLKMLKEAVNGY